MDAAWHESFVDFGDDALMPYARPPLTRIDSTAKEELRSSVSRFAPKLPGVYGMIDATGRLIYVGKSKSLRGRLLSYFMPNNTDEKAGRIIQNAESIVWEKQPSEFAALIREQSLIRSFQPRMNVVGMPKRQQQSFICLGNGPAEHFYLSKNFDPSAKNCQGPFYGVNNLNRAIEILNRMYLLRDCNQKTPMLYSDQLQLFDLELRAGCVRQEIGTCLAPCLSSCSRQQYAHQVGMAKEFLMANATDILDRLLVQMNRAAQGQHFEHAARMRDDFRIIKWLSNRLAQHRRARENYCFVYSIAGCDGRDLWYLIRKGGVEAALPIPKNAAQWRTVRPKLTRWFESHSATGCGYLRPEETIGIVTTWFQKWKDEFQQTRVLEDVPQRWSDMQSELKSCVSASA
jgi:excinuclease ABC subunit C